MAFWRGDFCLPDEPEAPAAPQEQTPETAKSNERGQSIVEYSILVVWMTLAFIGLIRAAGGGTKAVWSAANSNLSQANVTAVGS